MPGHGFLHAITFTVAVPDDLTGGLPGGPMLPVCSSAADILAVYNDWVNGFGYDGFAT